MDIPEIQFGLAAWSQGASWEMLRDVAKDADSLGYDDLWIWDHLLPIVGPVDRPIFDCWTVLAAWATVTSRIRLGPLVTANTFRNPGVVAKAVTTIDHISGGRAICGLGAGWFAAEHIAYGIECGLSIGERL